MPIRYRVPALILIFTACLLQSAQSRVKVASAPIQATTESGLIETSTVQVSAADGSLSLAIPSDWVSIDLTAAPEKVLLFGSSDAAMLSRQDALNAEDVTKVRTVESGGWAIVLVARDIGVTRGADMVEVLMNQFAASNFNVIEAAKAFAIGDHLGAYEVLEGGNSRELVAVVAFNDKIAYIVTSSVISSFDANRATLFAIIQSVRVPAETSIETDKLLLF